MELADIGPRIVVPAEGDWARWKRLATKREVLRCVGPMPSHPSGFSPEASRQRLAYLLTTAILKLNPASTYITIGTGVSTWANSGTASTSLDVVQASGSKQPTWASNSGANGGPGVTFAAASLQYLRSGAYAWNQPCSQIARAVRATTITGTVLDSGVAVNGRRMYNATAANPDHARIYAGSFLTEVASSVSNGTWFTSAGVYNSTSSALLVSGVWLTGNAGTTSGSGATLGAVGGSASNYWDGSVDWVIGSAFAWSQQDAIMLTNWIALR